MRSPKWTLPFLVLALVGCSGGGGGGSAPTPTASAKSVSGDLKVALLTPGDVSDGGWNALAWDGLQAIKGTYNADIANKVSTGTQIKDDLRSYAQQGYNLVFGHGYEYNEPALAVAKDFPNTYFVTSSGGKTAPNLGAFRFYLEQGFYLAGMLAAGITKTNTVAAIGGDDVPSIRSTFKGFEAGVKAMNPKVRVMTIFTGSGQDIAKAKQATLGAISQGADVVIHQANAAAQGVFDACAEKHVFAIGANMNQNGNDSGAVIASAVIIAQPAFLQVAKEVKNGTFKGGILLNGMENGSVDFYMSLRLAGVIPAKVKAKILAAREAIKSGKLVVPKDSF